MSVRRVLALALAGLLLSGCSDDAPTPKFQEPSASPTPSSTAGVEDPERESARDFIRRWVAEGDEMQVTGDTSTYEAMSSRCQACMAFARTVREVYEGGGSAQFEGSTIVRITRRAKVPPTYEVTKRVPKTVITRAGDDVEVLPAGRTTLLVQLGRSPTHQLVVTHLGTL